jgi:two-component system, cell cycle response regulator
MTILARKRIFVVEDDPNNISVTSYILRQQGATILVDSWNSHTVNLLCDYLPVDIILLDLMLLRGLSGYDVFSQLKTDPALAHIPVIAVSASDPAIEIPKAKAMGFAGFIGKPINLHLFPHQVLACLAGEPVWYTE